MLIPCEHGEKGTFECPGLLRIKGGVHPLHLLLLLLLLLPLLLSLLLLILDKLPARLAGEPLLRCQIPNSLIVHLIV